MQDLKSNKITNLKDDYIASAHKIIGANVKKARIAKGLTQLELSLAMGHKSVSVVSCAEIYHKNQHFNIEHLLKIARILEVDIQEFFEGV
ncbi:transcriptional regulator [Campylobacter sp. MIT 12-5580]|uniref:helix-turn-helix domain-containing protein n=1 Tax=Campylobacter sp. MIT 12-5580 TaxID=2040651 RepID=UPI0010F4FA06|nr:helix-turn-helix transcriptional regulator [Campylobacter sp. MIT 12-5580]TKX28517.1 transcriptional regulator [Campylobacter sp. MIT 12-5580]